MRLDGLKRCSLLTVVGVVCLIPGRAPAQVLEGTADVVISSTSEATDNYDVVSIARFDLERSPDNLWILNLNGEFTFSPENVVRGAADVIGELVMGLPVFEGDLGRSVSNDLPDETVRFVYSEWSRDGDVLFEKDVHTGWVEVLLYSHNATIDRVDVTFEVTFGDPEVEETRMLSGVLFGGRVTTTVSPSAGTSSVPRPTQHVSTGHRSSGGCGGGVSYYDDPYDNDGCSGDNSSASSIPEDDADDGCSGEMFESTAPDDDDDDDGMDEEQASDDEKINCAGDGGDSSTVAASVIPFRRPFVNSLAGKLHLWAPFLFLIFLKRRTVTSG